MSVEYVILCEDLQTEVFIRNFLIKRGVNKRAFTPLVCPSGKQSGEQWVRERFPNELKAIRVKNGVYLIACIDADTSSIEDRKNQLNRACTEAGVPIRSAEDRAMIAVPKRNIETWFEYLRGNTVDEESDSPYRKYKSESECKPDAATLHDMCFRKQKLREPAPASLVDACEEYKTLSKA